MAEKAIITGITGQDGSYLAQKLISKGIKVFGLTRSLSNVNRLNHKYLGINGQVQMIECDLLDLSQVIKIIKTVKPDIVYNLAAQSSVSESFRQPIGTIRFNITSVLNLLEAIKLVDSEIKFYQASSSEMYGVVNKLPVTEESTFHPVSPYGISKASAHWITVNYRESYGIHASSGILFNHESYLRPENFFIKKVILESIAIAKGEKEVLEVGNIDIKRDFGYAPEYVNAIYLLMQQEKPDDFIICSGKSVRLRDIIYHVFDRLGIAQGRLVVSQKHYRPSEIKNIYGDNTKAKSQLGWNYNISFFEVLDHLIEEELAVIQKNNGKSVL